MRKNRKKRYILGAVLLVAVMLAGVAALLIHGKNVYMNSIYPLSYEKHIQAASEATDITPSLIAAVICTESHFQPQVTSKAGAMGLMQLTPETFLWAQKRAGVKQPLDEDALFDPATNIYYGAYTLKLLFEQFKDEHTVLAAYNAGQGTVRKWIKDPKYSKDGVSLDEIPYAETAEYVKRVKTAQTIYRERYNLR